MKRIRTRTRIDTLANEQRASPIRWGRRIYLAILLGLGLFGIDKAVGDAFVLRADGLVVADQNDIAAIYVARVAKVRVREGQRVAAGDLVVELQSADMLRDIAQVSAQNADLTEREAQLQSRAATLAALLPIAERRARESTGVIGKLDRLSGSGLVSSERMDQALGSQYDAASRLVELRTEAARLAIDLPQVSRARVRASETLEKLDMFYNGGIIRAERAGTVGAHVPALGQVVKAGDELLEIYGDETSVLAYLPDMYLFPLKPGDRVEVSGGQARTEGTVEALLGVTAALPPEFQSMFRPRDRSRLVRIRLADGHRFAVAQKVQIGGCAFGWCWRAHPASELAATLWREIAAHT